MAGIGLVMASAAGAFAGGGLGAGATVVVARSRENGARREEWFRRFQYVSALVLAATDRERRVWVELLRMLVRDPLAGEGERDLGQVLLAMAANTGDLRDPLSRFVVDEEGLLGEEAAATNWRRNMILEDDDRDDPLSGEDT